jgi:hypothetical protein
VRVSAFTHLLSWIFLIIRLGGKQVVINHANNWANNGRSR